MLQNARITAFVVSELLRENQQGGGGRVKLSPPPPLPRLRLKKDNVSINCEAIERLSVEIINN